MAWATVNNHFYIVGGITLPTRSGVRTVVYEKSILKSVDGRHWEETDYKLKSSHRGRSDLTAISNEFLE